MKGAETKRQKAIQHIYREAKHPLGSLWDWARRGNTKRGRYRRWRSLQFWAQGNRDNSSGDEREKWNGIRKIYRKQKRKVYRRIHDNDDDVSGSGLIVTLDGKPCASWIARGCIDRRSKGWSGVLVSGYRTPEYSEQLCYQICGRPSCPGLCAGRSSNHCCPPTYSGQDGEGACDVSYYWEFPERDGLYNNLPRDLVHFSRSGN